jgi:hypothetical protein
MTRLTGKEIAKKARAEIPWYKSAFYKVAHFMLYARDWNYQPELKVTPQFDPKNCTSRSYSVHLAPIVTVYDVDNDAGQQMSVLAHGLAIPPGRIVNAQVLESFEFKPSKSSEYKVHFQLSKLMVGATGLEVTCVSEIETIQAGGNWQLKIENKSKDACRLYRDLPIGEVQFFKKSR